MQALSRAHGTVCYATRTVRCTGQHLARDLVTGAWLMFMYEQDGRLDIDGSARLRELLRALVHVMDLSAIIVTNNRAVAQLSTDRPMAATDGCVVDSALTDQLLTNPLSAHTQLLVSSVLQV